MLPIWLIKAYNLKAEPVDEDESEFAGNGAQALTVCMLQTDNSCSTDIRFELQTKLRQQLCLQQGSATQFS